MSLQFQIHKYTLPKLHPDVYTVNMNPNAQVLCIQIQHDLPTIWATVPEFALNYGAVASRIRVAWTGGYIGMHDKYLATVQHNGLVWHFFGAPNYD